MAKLPKALIKKYGISKKAWAVFRGQRTTRKTKTKSNVKRFYTMARRKKTRSYRAKSRSSSGFMGKAMQIIVGAGVAVAYDVFISPMIPLGKTIKNIVEMLIGVFLASSRKMPMFVRAGGFALATMNAYELIAPLLSGKGGIKVGGGDIAGLLQN